MQKQKRIQISEALPSVKTLGEKLFFKKPNIVLEKFAECLPARHSAYVYHLPSADIITLGEKLFFKQPNTVSKMFAECLPTRHSAYYYDLPRAALGDKEF